MTPHRSPLKFNNGPKGRSGRRLGCTSTPTVSLVSWEISAIYHNWRSASSCPDCFLRCRRLHVFPIHPLASRPRQNLSQYTPVIMPLSSEVGRSGPGTPGWVAGGMDSTTSTATQRMNQPISAVLHRSLKSPPRQVVSADGKSLTFSDGHTILDSTCGAAVACIGHNNKRVRDAMIDQIDKFSYCNSMFFGHPIGEQLAAELIHGTGGVMSKAYIMCSGKSLISYPRSRSS